MKSLFTCFLTLIVIWQATASGDVLPFDDNGDCDVDGLDLYRLISGHSGDFNDLLAGFGLQFGACEPSCDAIGIGTPIDGYPEWHERTLMVFTNMARMAPGEYRDIYMTAFTFPTEGILNDRFPSVPPLYFNHALNQSARYHAEDMAYHCQTLQHDSCDGTSFSDRIRSFYPTAGYIGENIAYNSASGTKMPWRIVSLFLCDPVNDICAADDQPFMVNGHRVNIMNSNFDEIGSGFAIGTLAYWVQDFNGVQLAAQPPVAAASHAIMDPDQIAFFLNYYDETGAAPIDVRLVLDGQPYSLALGTGVSAAGTYELSLPVSTQCRKYYFLVTDGEGKPISLPG